MLPELFAQNLKALEPRLEQLLAQSNLGLGTGCPRNLPELPGVYRFINTCQPMATVRVGRADVTLRQRIYTNHIMGDQAGNLRAQLCRGGECTGMDDAKRFIRQNLAVQVLPIEDERERAWIEYFMHAALRPRY